MQVVQCYPGSLGEIIQGKAYGKDLLLSCPVNLFTSVMVFESFLPVHRNKYPKCKKFMKNTLESWGYKCNFDELDIKIKSDIPIGKGFATISGAPTRTPRRSRRRRRGEMAPGSPTAISFPAISESPASPCRWD